MVLKSGTSTIKSKPITNMNDPYFLGSLLSFSAIRFPLKAGRKEAIVMGTSKLKSEGKKSSLISLKLLTFPDIHNIVVVTSPMGDQAPPALAAIIVMPAYHKRSSLLGINFLSTVMITIVVVRLSIIADRKKVSKPIVHKSDRLFLLAMIFLTALNPSK